MKYNNFYMKSMDLPYVILPSAIIYKPQNIKHLIGNYSGDWRQRKITS